MPRRKNKQSKKSSRRKKNIYEYFSVSSDIFVFRGNSRNPQVLLIQRKNPPFQHYWAAPGGFLDRDEDALTAAKRELHEEAGLKVARLVEFASNSDPDRDPRGRVVTISFYTRAPAKQKARAGDDAADAQWFSVKKLPPLAFDHRKMISKALIHLRDS